MTNCAVSWPVTIASFSALTDDLPDHVTVYWPEYYLIELLSHMAATLEARRHTAARTTPRLVLGQVFILQGFRVACYC